jgi:FMN phosphatase YigB (HAD superfamily)
VTINAVLLDVGGTLWPDRWTARPDDRTDLAQQVRQLAPELPLDEAALLVDILEEACADVVDGAAQTTTATIAQVLRQRHLHDQLPDPVAVQRALNLPFAGRHQLLPGAAGLIAALHDDGLRLVVISNTVTRDSACYWRDFADAGLADYLSGIVTSVDVGWRKPHRAIFDAALEVAGSPPDQAAIVGNSELSDITPGTTLGLTTIRVAIEEPLPAWSQADAVVTSLADVPGALAELRLRQA